MSGITEEGWYRLHPLSPYIRAATGVAVAAIAVAQQANAFVKEPMIAAGALLVILLTTAVYGWIAFCWTGYRVTTEQVELKSGVLFRSHRRIPRDRIEAIDVYRPMLARIFGLVELRIEVVSTGNSEMRFRYLDADDGNALRDYLLQANHPNATPTEATPPDDIDVLLEVPESHVLLGYGIARLALAVAIVIPGGAAGSVAGSSITFAAVVGFIPALVAIGVTTFSAIEMFWGFRVTRDGFDLTIRRGLINELNQKIPLQRIQGFRIDEPATWRPFGYVRLVVGVAGYSGSSNNGSTEVAVLAPIVRREHAERLLTLIAPDYGLDTNVGELVPDRARWRAPIRHRSMRLSMDTRWIASSAGVFRRSTHAIPHHKAQSVRVTQGPWQRRLRLATIHLDTAGDQLAFHALHRDADDARSIAYRSREYADGQPTASSAEPPNASTMPAT